MSKQAIQPASQEQLELLERLKLQDLLEENLPHKYERHWKWYDWAWEFYTTYNRMCILTAANQISKSSTAIRKTIEWATNKEIWKRAWTHDPSVFWYFYSTRADVTVEVEKKWIPKFLPRGPLINSPTWGYEVERQAKQVVAIHFKSGVSTYFKSWEMSVSNIQTTTVDLIVGDEEMPEEFLEELTGRLTDTNGYMWLVFTATLGQEIWRRAIEEPRGSELELFPNAWKRQVSIDECEFYRDGSPSKWTKERIAQQYARYTSEAARDKRCRGKFVLDTDRMFPGFDPKVNVKQGHPLPKSWYIYAGIDIGSGTNHPPAIVFLGVSPDFKQGRIFKCWRGDGGDFTAGDLVDKYLELKGDMPVVSAYYDWQSSDFGKIARRRGIPVNKADKARVDGIDTVNSLYKSQMVAIYDGKEERKLVNEMIGLKKDTAKPQAKDDLCDAQRFAMMGVPWDWTACDKPLPESPEVAMPENPRPGRPTVEEERMMMENVDVLSLEFAEANSFYEDLDDAEYF